MAGPRAVIIGIGTDLLDARRIARLHARYGVALEHKLLAVEEREALVGLSPERQANRIAKSFAAKEAAAKAMGSGFHGVGYAEVWVRRDVLGKPSLQFSARLAAVLAERGVLRTHLSLTDEKPYVQAFVLLEGTDCRSDGENVDTNLRVTSDSTVK